MERGDGQGGAKRRLSLSCRFLPPLSLALVLQLVAGWAPVGGPPLHDAPDLSTYPWLYLRGGQPLAAGEQVVEVVAVGDVMLGRGVAGEAQPFAAVAPWLRAADLVVANLECVIAAGGTPRPGPYRLRAPLPAAAALGDAGFDVVTLANNHSLDYGPQGLATTVARLQQAGIDAVGAGPDLQAALRPLIREAGDLRLAFLAFNSVPDPSDGQGAGGWTRADWDRERVLAAIAAARSQAGAVIVSVHWGYEYELGADPAQRDAARAMLDAGADLVIGHHPHVVQGTQIGPSEDSRGRFVAYSLGNFLFDQEQGEMQQGLALRAFFDGQGLRAVQALPLRAGLRPGLLAPGDAAPLLARVQPPGALHPEAGDGSRRTGFACAGGSCRPAAVPQAAAQGPFRAGAIDLTGDGLPEQVRREGDQVAVYDGGGEVWRGLPEWRVVDLALGDANDDGRGELLLALWKPDGDGVSRSHPFVAGYRQGAYRVLWGGSAAADPIREVELGDVDGDGRQELVALEERGDGSAVTVWRWHGWGFSLLWRSPPGRYRDLVLVPGEAGGPPLISVATDP